MRELTARIPRLTCVLMLGLSGCTSTATVTHLNISTGYHDASVKKDVEVSAAVCRVHVGKTVQEVTTPAALSLTLKRGDRLYVYCTKSGYQMTESFGAAMDTENAAYDKVHANGCNAVSVAGLGVAFVGAPIALLTRNAAWLGAPVVFGALMMAGSSIADIPYPRGYRYPESSVRINLYPLDYPGKEMPKPVDEQPEEAHYWKRTRCPV